MTAHPDNRPVVDWDRAATLDSGWKAVVAVRADGQSWPWLIAPGDVACVGCSCPKCAPHEQTGRLPVLTLKRLHGTCWRKGCDRPVHWRGAWCFFHEHTACSGTTAKGLPCRNLATDFRYDQYCPVHSPDRAKTGRRR